MDTLSLILVGVAALVILAGLWRTVGKPAAPVRLPYTRRPSLLTAGEQRFYRVLLQTLPPDVAVFVKVRLMDVVTVPEGLWAAYGAQGSGMHLDFVLVEASTLGPLLVLELDDRSHQRPEAHERDVFKNAALSSAGVPVLRVAVRARYDLGEVAARIKAATRWPC